MSMANRTPWTERSTEPPALLPVRHLYSASPRVNELVSAASLMSYGVMPEPALLNLFASELPKKATAAMQMMAMKATSSAYSTRAAPSSPLTYRARKYGTTCWRQYKARLTAFSMPPWCIRRLDGISPVTTLRHGGWRR